MWTAVTTAAVLDEFSVAEQKSLAAQNASGALELIVQREVAAWRGAIIAGGGMVAAAGTLPDQVVPDCIAAAKWRWLASLPGLKELKSEDRRTLYERAVEVRRDIAAGRIKVEMPTTAELNSATQPVSPVNQLQQVSGFARKTVTIDSSTGETTSELEGLL